MKENSIIQFMMPHDLVWHHFKQKNMKHLISIFIFSVFIQFNIFSQVISFNGGFKPNNLKGSHFGAKIDVFQKKKWSIGINYNLVKYTDIFAQPNITQPNLHIENTKDKTFIKFKELKRGVPIQFNDRDFRPRSLYHRFSLFVGYNIVNNNNFRVAIYGGPHFSILRDILYYNLKNPTPITINQGDTPIDLPYHDFQIFNEWDIGPGVRLDLEYKVFQNISFGVNSLMFMDVIGEGIDLMVGGVLSYNFNK